MTRRGCFALVGEDPQIRVIEEEFSIMKKMKGFFFFFEKIT